LKTAKEKPSTKEGTVDKAAVQNILRSVPFESGFQFATDIGKYTEETAINLFSFFEELRTIDLQSVKFHFQRRDYQKWIETTLSDKELSSRIDKTPSGLNGEELRQELLKIVQQRLIELQTAANTPSKQVSPEVAPSASKETSKKFTDEELKQYNGQEGKPAYITFEGKVYDVTNSSLWQGGDHLGAHQAGKDLTEAMKSAPHGEDVLGKAKQIGLLA
jgi:predicted heme/steroid binding protein